LGRSGRRRKLCDEKIFFGEALVIEKTTFIARIIFDEIAINSQHQARLTSARAQVRSAGEHAFLMDA